MNILVDVPFNQPVQEFFAYLEKHGATIATYKAIGPAGGNPEVTLAFSSKERALGYLRELYPTEDGATLLRLHAA